MPALNFTVFVDEILSGKKQQTIRLPRKHPIKPGDKLYLRKNGLKKYTSAIIKLVV